MQLEGNIAVFIRLDGESPVTVFQDENTQVNNVRVLAVGTNTDLVEVVGASFTEETILDGIIAFNHDESNLAADLTALVPHIKAGGDLQVYVADVTDDNKSAVLMALMIAGFVDTQIDPEVNEYPGLPNATLFTAKKQAEVKPAVALNNSAASTAQPWKKWTVVADDFEDEDTDDMIDEDTLLDDTDEVLKTARDDCEVGQDGKRRACKDCTCGRKDEENKPIVSDADLSEMVSSCGNCFKGDAFRCGGCPFLGKPVFKPGMEKVLLNLDDADDI